MSTGGVFARLWRRVTNALRSPAAASRPGEMLAGHHGGLDYRLYLPPGIGRRPGPLLLMLHGCQQDPVDFATGTGMNRLACVHGVRVLYPAQTERANGHRCWNWFKPQHQHRGRGEPAQLAALVREVMTQHPIDPARVYVAGLSAGGAMADVMAQTHPDLFAAVGIHAGLAAGAAHTAISALSVMKNGPALPLALTLAGGSRMRVPTIVFQGDADTTVHPRNAERLVAAALGGDEAEAQRHQGVAAGGRRFRHCTYPARAATRPDVEFWRVDGLGHAWSGGDAAGTFTDPAGPDASAEMLRFFLAHPAPAAGA